MDGWQFVIIRIKNREYIVYVISTVLAMWQFITIHSVYHLLKLYFYETSYNISGIIVIL